MRFHHAYVGIALIVWSLAAIFFGALTIGEFKPWLAWCGLLLGAGLAAHDFLLHLGLRKAR